MLLQLKKSEGSIKLDSNLYWNLNLLFKMFYYCSSQQLYLSLLFE